MGSYWNFWRPKLLGTWKIDLPEEERKKFRDKRMQTAAEGKQAPLLVDCPWLYSNIAKKK